MFSHSLSPIHLRCPAKKLHELAVTRTAAHDETSLTVADYQTVLRENIFAMRQFVLSEKGWVERGRENQH